MPGGFRLRHASALVASALVLTATGAAAATTGAAGAASLSSAGSRVFAGWEVVEPTKHITSATVTFTVPKITCHQNASGVGPTLLIDSTVHHHAYTRSGGGVAVVCRNLVADYVALPVVDSHGYDDYGVPISAGDSVTLSVRYGTATTVTLLDHTDHQKDVRTGGRSRGAAAFFGDSGVQINHVGVGLDPFTKTSFTAAKVNGHPIGSQPRGRYRWVDSHHVTLVKASALSRRDDFSTTFVRSS